MTLYAAVWVSVAVNFGCNCNKSSLGFFFFFFNSQDLLWMNVAVMVNVLPLSKCLHRGQQQV